MKLSPRQAWGSGMFTVLGIDASLTSTGLALMDQNTGTVIGTGTVGSAKLRGGERLKSNLENFRLFYKPQETHIQMICLEDYAYGAGAHKNNEGVFQGSQRFLQTAEWTGVIKVELAFVFPHVPLVLVSPPTLKKFVTGSGNSPKENLMLEAYKRFGWEAPTNDEIDALGLAALGRCLLLQQNGNSAWQEGLSVKQKEAVLKANSAQATSNSEKSFKRRIVITR
jgi:Holliday junction resolvasome RuvABC endonuclease subunit